MEAIIKNRKAILFAIAFLSCGCAWARPSAEVAPVAKGQSGGTVVFKTGFETDSGGFTPRGGKELLTRTREAAHTGRYALKVENRTSAWHGPSARIERHIAQGKEYAVSLWVKLIDPETAQIQVSTQIGEGTSASYNTIAGKTIRADDGWVLFEGTYRYDNLSSGFITIYVESSSNTTASFYIDDVQIEELPAPVIVIEDIPSLKSVYADQFLIGNIASPSDLEGLRFELLTKHFNVITAENAMKPGSLQPNKGEFAFAGADKIVNAVIAAGMKMHGHTLAWHQQSPNWMNYDGISKEEAVENLTTHAKTVVDHFKGRVISWDVLNEAVIDNPPNPKDWRASLRQTPWLKAIGTEYIAILFRAAREADTTAQLYYNDYNLDNQNKALAVYTMVKELNEQNPDVAGRPLIDGIGMQGHYRVNTNPNNVGLSLERFSGLGVEISITELDVQAGNDAKLTEQQAITQGLAYAALFSAFKTYADKIARVTVWGLDDRSSWRSSASPVLFDKNLKAKLAFYAAEDPDGFTEQYKSAVVKETKQAKAVYGTPVIGGALDPLWNSAEELSINQYLMAWQGAAGTAKVLWDEQYLYVLAQVQNAELNKASPNAYEQDSVEVFIDENNGKTSYFEADDGQYRVNFANETSFNPRSLAEGFVSYTAVSEKAYIVIMKIPFRTVAPTPNMRIGFDAQINGASAQGIRQSVSIWNDTSGNSFQDTSGYGTLQLVK